MADQSTFSDKIGYPLGEEDQRLTEEELDELAEALGDGFTSVNLLRYAHIGPLKGLVDEPFWGATVGASKDDINLLKAYSAELEKEGYSKEQILEQFLDELEGDLPDDAPHWLLSNPFGFGLVELEAYFIKKCDESLGDTSLFWKNGGDLAYIDFVQHSKPFSRVWFELHIAYELWLLKELINDFPKDNEIAAFWAMLLIPRAGSIGRLIESYRWRFAYGDHALRGKKIIGSAGEGGRARARQIFASTHDVLGQMSILIKKGLSISRAAQLAHSRGLGSSPSANRKLWSRHKKK